MVDAHKYCAQGRAAVFGEPDFVLAAVRLCCENGIVPVLAATGSACPGFRTALLPEMEEAARRALSDRFEIVDDCDFAQIESLSRALDVNLLLGSSDGRRAAKALDADLIRLAFPIHDRVGGQRVRTLGFEGGLSVLDAMANSLLARTEEGYRDAIYQQHFPQNPGAQAPSDPATPPPPMPAADDRPVSRLDLPPLSDPEPRARFAVATKSGMMVDSHFGHATEFYIYESDGSDAVFLERRPVRQYCLGRMDCDESPEDRMAQTLFAVSDCQGVLVLRIGDAPSQKLAAKGIRVFTVCDRIEDAVKAAAQALQNTI
jgi:predicted Fe-Mo cluster-binding NifX family protein